MKCRICIAQNQRQISNEKKPIWPTLRRNTANALQLKLSKQNCSLEHFFFSLCLLQLLLFLFFFLVWMWYCFVPPQAIKMRLFKLVARLRDSHYQVFFFSFIWNKKHGVLCTQFLCVRCVCAGYCLQNNNVNRDMYGKRDKETHRCARK